MIRDRDRTSALRDRERERKRELSAHDVCKETQRVNCRSQGGIIHSYKAGGASDT